MLMTEDPGVAPSFGVALAGMLKTSTITPYLCIYNFVFNFIFRGMVCIPNYILYL